MDADKFSFPFVIRRWKAGDWLVPFGMKGKKKVSDLFTDLKYDTFQKENAVILSDIREDGGETQRRVAAVAGVRIDDRYRVTSSTVSVLRITCTI
jgi:tRNA(Ile)-lysidine synthase